MSHPPVAAVPENDKAVALAVGLPDIEDVVGGQGAVLPGGHDGLLPVSALHLPIVCMWSDLPHITLIIPYFCLKFNFC